MIRSKGGKRQPRYYYLKEAGEKRLVNLMTKPQQKKVEPENKVDKVCQDLLLMTQQVDLLIAAVKVKLESFREHMHKVCRKE